MAEWVNAGTAHRQTLAKAISYNKSCDCCPWLLCKPADMLLMSSSPNLHPDCSPLTRALYRAADELLTQTAFRLLASDQGSLWCCRINILIFYVSPHLGTGYIMLHATNSRSSLQCRAAWGKHIPMVLHLICLSLHCACILCTAQRMHFLYCTMHAFSLWGAAWMAHLHSVSAMRRILHVRTHHWLVSSVSHKPFAIVVLLSNAAQCCIWLLSCKACWIDWLLAVSHISKSSYSQHKQEHDWWWLMMPCCETLNPKYSR